MEVSVEQSGELERKMTVAVAEDVILGKVQDRLQELRKTVRIDGFRPGKVPPNVVKRRFGARVREEVLGELLRSSIVDAIDQENLRPVGEPNIEPIQMEPGDGMKYAATFEVYPTVELAPVEKLKIERPVCVIADADVEEMIVTLREQNKAFVTVDRPTRDGDQLTIDFEGRIDGEIFDGGEAEDFELVLGVGQMIEGFEEGLVGKSAGEIAELQLGFPADYRAAALAGQEAVFKITIKAVAEPKLPALDEEFFAKFGVEEGGVEAFRAEVRANMERERERALKRRFNSGVLDAVSDANELKLPKALVDAEIQRMQQQALQTMLQQGQDLSGLDPANLPGPGVFEQPAEKRVKLGLLMAEMIKTAEITADPAAVRAVVESMAESYEDPTAVVKWYYEEPTRLQEIEASCLEDEAVAWIAERAEVSETTISFDDLMNPGQTAAEIKD